MLSRYGKLNMASLNSSMLSSSQVKSWQLMSNLRKRSGNRTKDFFSLRYINGIQFTKFGLWLTEHSHYPWKWDQIGFSFVVDKSKIGKKRDTVYSHEDANDSLKIVASELDKYIYNIDKEFQYTDDFILCVAPFVFCLVLDKISKFISQNH